jgi:hypothetical protein
MQTFVYFDTSYTNFGGVETLIVTEKNAQIYKLKDSKNVITHWCPESFKGTLQFEVFKTFSFDLMYLAAIKHRGDHKEYKRKIEDLRKIMIRQYCIWYPKFLRKHKPVTFKVINKLSKTNMSFVKQMAVNRFQVWFDSQPGCLSDQTGEAEANEIIQEMEDEILEKIGLNPVKMQEVLREPKTAKHVKELNKVKTHNKFWNKTYKESRKRIKSKCRKSTFEYDMVQESFDHNLPIMSVADEVFENANKKNIITLKEVKAVKDDNVIDDINKAYTIHQLCLRNETLRTLLKPIVIKLDEEVINNIMKSNAKSV